MKKTIIGAAAFVIAAAALAILAFVKLKAVPNGADDIKNARKLYEKLDSARLTMTDNSTGENLMDFSFYINGDNEMIFEYVSPQSGDHAYSDGKQFYYKTDGEWTAITPADESYIHNIYNREYRYPYARGSVFFMNADAVSEATVEEQNGGKTITYVYDCEKLNKKAVKDLENVSEFSALTCVYSINADGLITRFTEKGAVTDAEGKASDVDITLEVSEVNKIKFIEKPFDE